MSRVPLNLLHNYIMVRSSSPEQPSRQTLFFAPTAQCSVQPCTCLGGLSDDDERCHGRGGPQEDQPWPLGFEDVENPTKWFFACAIVRPPTILQYHFGGGLRQSSLVNMLCIHNPWTGFVRHLFLYHTARRGPIYPLSKAV